MNTAISHSFDLTPRSAVQLQRQLAQRVVTRNEVGTPHTVAGADVALDPRRGTGFAGVILYSYPDLVELERSSASGPLTFPYIPGLLSFREGPLLLSAFARLRHRADLLLFDGQGLAHPRRFGLACHLAVLLDRPGIGVAKSRLLGRHLEPGPKRGAWTLLRDGEETIGAVVRTRSGVRPLFISIGHKIDLEGAIRFTLACGDGLRVPKPTREADRFVAALKRNDSP